MDATLARVAHYVAAADFESLPSAAVHECRRRVIDAVAAAAAAWCEPFCAGIHRVAQRHAGTLAARLWGSGAPTSVEMAAFANGTLLRYLDCNDTWVGRSNGHPSDMIAGLVALAEARDRSGRDLVISIVVAYEVYCSLCDAAPLGARGIDQATSAAVGAAAGAARLLGLDAPACAQALSLALSANVHLYNVRHGELSDWKGCAGPNGVRNGLFAAQLAAEGVTGPTAPVEGRGGLHEVVGPLDWQVGARELPLLVQTHLKLHPVCYHGQSAVDAALALRATTAPEDIESVEIETYEAAFRAMAGDAARWAPANRETADHSLPYTVAVALLNGRLVSQDYAAERLADARTRQLMQRIRVTAAPELTRAYPAQTPTRITLHRRGGGTRTHLQSDPKGHARNPLSDAELEAKFVGLFAPWSDATAAHRVLDRLWALDGVPHVALLVDALCPFAARR